ncbi:MAG TPA: RNA polymerase subunit sigma-24 [Chloroflexi bacterium]|nr:RNA polymerase subunit sigma-24 [Chloroflexota bacterium]
MIDEAKLVTAAQRGELPAFNQLVLHYQGLAYNVAYRVMGTQDGAADATQDAFLKAYKGLQSFRGGNFKSWLLRIVTNTCYDHLRALKRRPTTDLDDLLVDPDHNWRVLDPAEGPAEHAERLELADLLQWAIAQLPPDQRAVVVLSDIQGLSYEEIAEVMDTSLGTVKSRLSRARAKLRHSLQTRQELLPLQYRLTDGLSS